MRGKLALALVGGGAIALSGGAVLTALTGDAFMGPVVVAAKEAVRSSKGGDIALSFTTARGWISRHPVLIGGEDLPEDTRAAVARAVAAVPGVGGVRWQSAGTRPPEGGQSFEPLHCQQDVEGLLRSRSIRFEEGSASLVPASDILLDEVAEALRPCAGAIIAITGHTDRSGSEAANAALSMERARAVREALVRRGIPREGLRARGLGSERLARGLSPSDPANRRIEFSVLRTEPLTPTPIDTPQAY